MSIPESTQSKSAIQHNIDLVIKVLIEKGGYIHEGKAYLNGMLICCPTLTLDEAVKRETHDENDYWDKEEAADFIDGIAFFSSLGFHE